MIGTNAAQYLLSFLECESGLWAECPALVDQLYGIYKTHNTIITANEGVINNYYVSSPKTHS